MAQTVIGMFESSSKAQEAVQELVEAGIGRDKIDVSVNSSAGSSYSSGTSDLGSGLSSSGTSDLSSGSSYSYGTSGNNDNESGISKFFKSLFGDNDNDADKYTHVASRSQSIVTVHAQSGDEAERVADILDDNGAVDIDEHAAKMGYGTSGTTTTGSDYTTGAVTGTTAGYTGTSTTADQTNKIPIIEENLAVGKREVQTGGVRLRSRIIERPVEESIRLREERVNVERTAVDRPATAADFENFKERNIEMVERAEVPVVSKEARVVEEISIGKEVEERTETVSDTVRKTEVDVEELNQSGLKGGSSGSSSLGSNMGNDLSNLGSDVSNKI